MSKSTRKKACGPPAVGDSVTAEETVSGRDIMQEVLSKPRSSGGRNPDGSERIEGVIIGTFVGTGEEHEALVDFPGIPGGEPVPALSSERLSDFDSGRQVALSFVQGNPLQPIILGVIQQPPEPKKSKAVPVAENPDLDVRLDGERLTLSADHEITLQCGKSSITLTRAGKIIIKGAYLSNHSTGVNRIKGGSVQIN